VALKRWAKYNRFCLSLRKGEENVDWKSLIGEHSYFAGIKIADFPPLYDARDFETCFDDFLAIVEEPRVRDAWSII
jgi:hypothetical protein